MKVTLRKRNQGGSISLYLDYYHRGKRTTEYLRLYLDPNPKTREQKDSNKKTLALAEAIRAKRLVEIQNNHYGFQDNQKSNGSFIEYLELLAKKRFDSPGNHGNWKSVIKHFKDFAPHDITFSDIDRNFVSDFKDYLNDEAISNGETKLSQNTKYSYFNKFRAALKQAVKDGIIQTNPSTSVAAFKQDEPNREFLTLEELQAAVKESCEDEVLKRAFVFSCLTGLRWSDIEKLKWSEIQYSKEMGHYIRFIQKKTKGAETLPISEEAFSLLGEKKERNDLVFNDLKYSAWHNKMLSTWISNAGIHKKITFHCARHTYATLQLTLGTDIYTVSKLLGHKDLKTTQVYAKVIDEKKREAANKIKLSYKS